ncbi:MAG: MBL fold metallo-hydrolase [Phycisphaerales bacterium]|jgi:glyoxylase-like metal-dependent hydrolase (beta-lactamase superfamily II)|nr:MBL fold metallo-hydrolase [Phycisphaerales bacterium]
MIPTPRVISIGTLAQNTLWNEPRDTRTGHATTTLVEGDGVTIMVDPGLPSQVVAAKLVERSPLQPADITHVFLTSFQDDTIRGLAAFPRATWLAFDSEIEAATITLQEQLQIASEHPEDGGVEPLETRLRMLERINPAPESLAGGIDLFPLAGVTPGLCGLLLAQPRKTILITGDAIATREHLAEAKVLPTCWNRDLAQESFAEAIHIADIIIPGRDNLLPGV